MPTTERLNERLASALLRRQTGRAGALLLGRAAAGIWALLRIFEAAGRPVLIPANTCYIVLWAALLAEARPVLVDADPATGVITPQTLDAALASQPLGGPPAAVIPCHLYGLPAPMRAITDWAAARGVRVIEDAAQALGGIVDGRPVGAWGDAAVFSFGAGKIVDLGLGGALLSDDPTLLDEAAALLMRTPLYDDALAQLDEQWLALYWAMHQFESDNQRLPPLYAPLFDIYQPLVRYRAPARIWRTAPASLDALHDNLAHRAGLADLYDAQFSALPAVRSLPRPAQAALWKYPLRASAAVRDDLLKHLWANGVEQATRWYPSLHVMAAALAPGMPQPPTPDADALSRQIINLPLDSRVTAEEVERIGALIRAF